MKPGNPVSSRIRLATVVSLFVALAFISGACTSDPKPDPSQSLTPGSGVPAGQGTVIVAKGANENTRLTLHVKHLAPPANVVPNATVYVVWVQPRNGLYQNVGALTLNANLEGSLTTTTPHRQFKLTITPEPSGRGSQPTTNPVFTSEVDRVD